MSELDLILLLLFILAAVVVILVRRQKRRIRQKERLFKKWEIFAENRASWDLLLAEKRAKGEPITLEDYAESKKNRLLYREIE